MSGPIYTGWSALFKVINNYSAHVPGATGDLVGIIGGRQYRAFMPCLATGLALTDSPLQDIVNIDMADGKGA